ncbi:MAG TPA: hypothetical protein VMB79_03760 [Jatrophihabitans sp.]|nr:hypothetical protein [Jatrophihabitans sp.]
MSRQTTPAAIRAAVLAAATAAAERDPARFAEAAAALAALEPAQLSIVQAGVIRQLLEVVHPDGVDSTDARQLLADTSRAGAAWWPHTAPDAVLVVLLTSLGVAEAETPWLGAQAPRVGALAAHASLLIAELAGRQAEPLAGFVDRALGEIQRAETMEMP